MIAYDDYAQELYWVIQDIFLKSNTAELYAPMITVTAGTTNVTGVVTNSYDLIKDYKVQDIEENENISNLTDTSIANDTNISSINGTLTATNDTDEAKSTPTYTMTTKNINKTVNRTTDIDYELINNIKYEQYLESVKGLTELEVKTIVTLYAGQEYNYFYNTTTSKVE